MTSFPTKPLARLGGHNGQVLALTYSSGSGQYLLTASTDRLIRLFSPLSRSPLIQTFSAHGYLISDLCISSTNATFLSCGGDKIVFLWDVSTASTLRRWAGHAGRINAVRFAGDEESVVVSGSYDGTVKIWDVKQRGERPVVTWGEAGDSVAAVEVGDTEVWVGSVDGRVRGYDVRTGKVVVDVIGAPVTSLSLAKAGDAYLVGTLDSTLRLMDRRDGKCLQTFKDGEFDNQNYRLRSTFAAADSLVMSGSEDGYVYVWDMMTGRVEHKLRHTQSLLGDGRGGDTAGDASKKSVVSAVAWNQLKKQWASAGGDGTVVVWGRDE